MSSNLRFKVVETAFHKKPLEVELPKERPSEYFAKYVFNKEKMFKYLPSNVYNALMDVIENGANLDRNIADAVAEGMKRWAMELGVTHYTLVPPVDRRHRREARRLCGTRRQRRIGGRILRQAAGTTGN